MFYKAYSSLQRYLISFQPVKSLSSDNVSQVTLCPDWFRHGAGVTQALRVDSSHHEQVDGVGPETFNGELGGLNVVRYCLPAVTHRLAVRGGNKSVHFANELAA